MLSAELLVCIDLTDEEDVPTVIEDDSVVLPNISATAQRHVTVTTDNAANVTKAITESDMFLVRCFAHTINLSVQKFIKIIDDQLKHMRAVVRYFHNSPGATAALKVGLNKTKHIKL